MDNRRKSQRLDCVVPVDGKQDSLFDHLQAVDLSSTGIGFLSKKEIPVNQEIPIELDLKEDDDAALAIGVVRWVRKTANGDYRIGLEFKELIEDSDSRIEQYFS